MIFRILLSRSVQTPNSDKNWQTSCPLQTFVCNISRHLEFIIKQDHRVSWVSGSLDSRVTGSLGHKMWPSSISGAYVMLAVFHATATMLWWNKDIYNAKHYRETALACFSSSKLSCLHEKVKFADIIYVAFRGLSRELCLRMLEDALVNDAFWCYKFMHSRISAARRGIG